MKSAADWFDEARAALERRDGDAILDCTEAALELDPEHAEAKALRFQVLVHKVESLESAGDWEDMLVRPSVKIGG